MAEVSGTGVLYPSRDDTLEFLKVLDALREGASVDQGTPYGQLFEQLIERAKSNPIYGALPEELLRLNKLANKASKPTGAKIRQLEAAREALVGVLEKTEAKIDGIRELLKERPPEFFSARKEESEARRKELKSKYKKTLKELLKAKHKAELKYGPGSSEYQEARADYHKVKELMEGPRVAYNIRYGELEAQVQEEIARLEKLLEKHQDLKRRIEDLENAFQQTYAERRREAMEELKTIWSKTFESFARAMRWDNKVIERFGDPDAMPKGGFLTGITSYLDTIYSSDMYRSQHELEQDSAERAALREVCGKKANALYIAPTSLDYQNTEAQQKVERLLDAAEATVNAFARVPMYALRTEIDFKRNPESYHERDERGNVTGHKFVANRRVIPRIGYFQFKLVASDAYRDYEDFLTKFRPISRGARETMIEALTELSQTFTEYGRHIRSVNEVTKTVMFGDEIFSSQEAISIDIMQAAIGAAVAQLEKEEPDIDSYVRSYIASDTPGYIGGQVDDIRCEFYNPFSIAPVYYIFGVAGASHKAINKVHYWLHIENSQCEDMDCIPSALEQNRAGLVAVPPEQVTEIRKRISFMSAEELADTAKAYETILKPLTAPWVIIKKVQQLGKWDVYKCSDSSLSAIQPLDFKARMGEVIGLLVHQGHVSRITGFEDYDGAGWEYDLEGFIVAAKVNRNTGVGVSVPKLLRGNAQILEAGCCCIGERTYKALNDFKRALPGGDMLEYLSSREIIPSLVQDALELAESEYELGPGVINGATYESVPRHLLSEETCIKDAYDEWDSRKAGAKDAFKVWSMLRLPRWIVVTNINKSEETWTVERASDSSLLGCTPVDALMKLGNLVVLLKRTPKEGTKQSPSLYRAIDYFIKLPNDDGSTDQYTGRHNLVVTCNSTGILSTIRSHMPKGDDGSDLIYSEELLAAEAEDSIEKQLQCFRNVRYVIVTDLELSKSGRVRSFEATEKRGKVTASDIIDGAPDLLRLWQDPNKQTWLIVDHRWYDIQSCIRELQAELPVAYIGADYETLNKGSETNAILLSWARQDAGTDKITSGCFEGTQCTRQFTTMIAKIATEERRRVIVITFHGSFFDLHMMLEGIATWGNFGQLNTDRIVAVGNKILEIDWLKAVKFIDLRRFTQNSLAGICEAFHVKNPKSDINLKLVQETYERCNCNLESFWIELRKMPALALVSGIEDDRKCPEFVEKISKMRGDQAYVEYCINDSVATVQCYMKVKQACADSVVTMSVDAELKKELTERYNIDDYCTIPSMAYKCYRAGLPKAEGVRVLPPVAANLHIHQHIKACGIGGRSEIYDFVPPHIIQENHQVFDVASLFPFGAMVGHMPAGDLHAVSQEGEPISQDLLDSFPGDNSAISQAQLPVPNKLGFYYCTITAQPDFIVIPRKEQGQSLDWKCREPFSRWVHVVMIRLHLYLGGQIKAHYGYYWDGMNDHYFDNSLRFWKAVKMAQDVLKGMLPTVSDEDPSVDTAKLEEMLLKKDPKVAWAFTDGVRDEAKIKKVLEDYNPMVRWLVKMMSNSLLGRTAKKLREYELFILSGSAPVQKFIEEHQNETFVIHQLSKNREKNPSVMTQLTSPYSKCSMVALDTNQEDLFSDDKGKESTKIPEACVSVTMFAYTHFHMALAMDRFYKAKSVRGIETDGIHANQAQYIQWCKEQGIENPFWIESPLAHIQPGSVLDDAVFKPTPGDQRSAEEIPRLGAFYCPSAANRFIAAVNKALPAGVPKLPEVSKVVEYGCFTEELRNQGLYDVFYPFCKFYYYKCLETGHETIRAKGVSASKKSPSREGRDYLMLEHSPAYKAIGNWGMCSKSTLERMGKTLEQMKLLQACINVSKPVVNRELFEKIGAGVGVDAVDYRFQGRLSKINASHIHTEDLVPGNNMISTPIHYTLCTKRIEPHKAYRVSLDGSSLVRNGVPLSDEATKRVEDEVRSVVERDDPIAKRGFTLEVDGSPAYFATSLIRKILNRIKERSNEDKRTQV